MDVEHLFDIVIGTVYMNKAITCEFKRVFNQIYEHLGQANFISFKAG